MRVAVPAKNSSTKALDRLFGVEPPPAAKKLRELLYCAFFVTDHTTHFYVLAGPDCVAELWVDHVHIMVDNTCKMQVTPSSFTVQPGQKLRLDYHNHSVDYPVDVWMHYNGGYTDLQPGATWMEKYEHCFGPAPSEGWAKISTACSEYVLPIHCL